MSSESPVPRGRFRFVRLDMDPSPDGKGNVSVHMEWQGRELLGEASGIATREGDLRMGAEASLDTIRSVTKDKVDAELRGVKAVRAFDAWVVIASVHARAEGQEYRLLGAKACESEDDLTRSAAIAVLDALNRLIERVVH